MCVYVCAAFQGGAGNLGQRLLGPSAGPGLMGVVRTSMPSLLFNFSPSIPFFCPIKEGTPLLTGFLAGTQWLPTPDKELLQ